MSAEPLRSLAVIGGVSVLFLMATEYEYGPHLRQRISPLKIPGIPEASISTGGQIVAGGMYDAIAADMVDMESFSVVRAGAQFSVPSVILRGISDGRGEVSKFEHWTEYLHVVDENLAAAVDVLFAFALGGGLKKQLA